MTMIVCSAVIALSTFTGCGSTTAGERTEVVVLAASSLTDVMADIESAIESLHPQLDITVSVAGSTSLAAQVADGAPADVLATADWTSMTTALDGRGVTVVPVVFATNRLVVAVEPGNPHNIRGLDDLDRDELVVVLADPTVPAGRYARVALADAGVVVIAASYEQHVRSVLAKVSLGEADAGVVYATDVAAARGTVDAIEITNSPVAEYPVAPLTTSDASQLVVDFLTGADGATMLTAHGFESTTVAP